jgi:hypothetical protein
VDLYLIFVSRKFVHKRECLLNSRGGILRGIIQYIMDFACCNLFSDY